MNITRWLLFFGFIFVISTLLSNIMQGTYYGTSDLYFVTAMNDFKMAFTEISLSSLYNVLSGTMNMVRAVGQWVTWDYAFFYGQWEIVRYLCMVISFGFLTGFVFQIASSLRWI